MYPDAGNATSALAEVDDKGFPWILVVQKSAISAPINCIATVLTKLVRSTMANISVWEKALPGGMGFFGLG